MDTKPIFDYLHEIESRKSFTKPAPDALSDVKLKSWQDYLHFLHEMRGEFEACVFQCTAENPQFKDELHVIANKLQRWITIYENRQRDMPQMFDDSSRVALTLAKDSLRFLQENYGIGVEVEPKPKPELEPNTVSVESETLQKVEQEDCKIITGIRNLAKVLDIGVNKATAIVHSGILEKEHIQWNEGFWKFDKEKLLQFKKDNPNAFAKIKCKR